MVRMKRIMVFVLLSVVLGCFSGEKAVAAGVSLVTDEDERYVSIPAAYEVKTTYKNLGDYGFLNHAEDLFVDNSDCLYVADTGNNRILKFSPDGEVMAEYTEGFGVPLKNPKGIYVHEDGTIWIADTGNYRVVRIAQDGADVEVYYKPESDLLEESFTFAPEKIYVSGTGYMYVLKGTSLMKMDSKNTFRGYVGAAAVPFSLSRFLIRMFGSQSQVERTMKQEPSAYSNFMIASDGMIYGLLANETSGQIRRLNSVGTNTYPENKYGFDIIREDGSNVQASFADITVMDNGVITLCDRNTGLLYQYTQDGDLLAVFGGTGNKNGVYQNIVSITHDSEGNLYVLDYTAGNVTLLRPTRFIQMVHEAVSYYNDGDYKAAEYYWKQVLEADSNYAMAHSGYAKVLFKEENYQEAMRQYSLGGDKEGYSDAFAEYRHNIFRKYFGWICLAVVLLLGGLWIGFKRLKKYVDDMAERIEYGGSIE